MSQKKHVPVWFYPVLGWKLIVNDSKKLWKKYPATVTGSFIGGPFTTTLLFSTLYFLSNRYRGDSSFIAFWIICYLLCFAIGIIQIAVVEWSNRHTKTEA